MHNEKHTNTHHHQHEAGHQCEGGCCSHSHSHSSGCGGCQPTEITLGPDEAKVLLELAQYQNLPVCRYLISSSKNEDVIFSALSRVYLSGCEESLDEVKYKGKVLAVLESKGLIEIDYEMPLQGYDYDAYKNSAVFQYLKETIHEGMHRGGFLCDRAGIDYGSMVLTSLGEMAVDKIDHRYIEELEK